MKKTPLLPFRWMPASWGLHGQNYDLAEAAYLYEGEELERRNAEIHHPDKTSTEYRIAILDIDRKHENITAYEYDLKMLDINGQGHDRLKRLELEFKHERIPEFEFEHEYIMLTTEEGDARTEALVGYKLKHGRIDEYTHDKTMIELQPEGRERDLALLELDFAHDKIEKRAYEKQKATLKEEPWIGVIDDGYDLNQGTNGLYFELDWNSYWIEYLRLNGYGGRDEEQIVKRWFADVCMATVVEAEEAQEQEDPFPQRARSMIRSERGYRG